MVQPEPPNNRSRKALFVLVASICIIGSLLTPFVVRGISRWYVMHRFFKLSSPEAIVRVNIHPTHTNYYATTQNHPINIGYATFDTGGLGDFVTRKAGHAAVILTNSDFNIVFMSPHNPTANALNTTSGSKKAAPASDQENLQSYVTLLETDPIKAFMRKEKVRLLSFSQIFRMSKDQFTLLVYLLAEKSRDPFGSREVRSFESPFSAGIAYLGKGSADYWIALVVLQSLDGNRAVGIRLTMQDDSPKTVDEIVNQIASSFRFTTSTVDDQEKIVQLISDAGIPQREVPEEESP